MLTRIFFLPLILLLASCATKAVKPLPTVPVVEVPRYMGKWYEVARLPAFFQRNCVDSTAEYSLNSDGMVAVVNRCLDGNGKSKEVKGIARVVNTKSKAVLEVKFTEWFSAFIPPQKEGNYFIIWLSPDYSTAAVGVPSRKYLWILSRKPQMPEPEYQRIVAHCRKLGFPVDKLIRDMQD
jgi:apolipoprotein D and lipocalin family protein